VNFVDILFRFPVEPLSLRVNDLGRMKTPSPINWFGGKSRLASRIVEHFPKHHTYCEPFGGSAAVLLAKGPSKVEVYNDLNRELVNFFVVLRDPVLFARLREAVEHTPYARAEFELSKQKSDDPVESARRFIVRSRQSFLGKGCEWSYSIRGSQGGMASSVQRWNKGIEYLPAAHDRFQAVQIECDDWYEVMSRYDSRDTLFFIDPPYVPATRVSGKYRHELTQNDHREIVARLIRIQGMVILSGYEHETYEPLERAGWKRIDYKMRTHASDFRAHRVESVWLCPSVLNHSRNRTLFLSPIERRRHGAYQSHRVRVDATTRKVARAISRFRVAGKKVTISSIGRATGMTREHLSRKYRHLFGA
jgi:DNA adenine methylase